MEAWSSTVVATVAAWLCVVGALIGLGACWRPAFRWLSALLGTICFVPALVAWIVRWIEAGHLPLFGTYEGALSLTLFTLLAALLAARVGHSRTTPPAGLWPTACAISAALLFHGLSYDATSYALTISERSWVVDVHAVVAWATFAALAANAGLAVARLLTRERTHLVDRPLAFTLSLGFLLHTAMLVTGSVYLFLLFGETWSFDPIEAMGFIVWIAYGTLLHMHLFAAWRGRRLAAWCLGLFVLLVVSYRGIVYFPPASTYHIFDMNLRIHVVGTQPGGNR